MQKIKEEFFLSFIFVLKWLSFGLGTLAIVYFAISLAYHISYYDPLIKEYDLKIADFNKKKIDSEVSLHAIKITLQEIQAKMDILKKTDIPAAKNTIASHEKKIESLDESIIDRYNPFHKKNDKTKQVYKERDKAIKYKKNLNEQLEDLRMTKAVKAEAIPKILEKINQIEIFISVKEHEKEKVDTSALGIFPWLFMILGLT